MTERRRRKGGQNGSRNEKRFHHHKLIRHTEKKEKGGRGREKESKRERERQSSSVGEGQSRLLVPFSARSAWRLMSTRPPDSLHEVLKIVKHAIHIGIVLEVIVSNRCDLPLRSALLFRLPSLLFHLFVRHGRQKAAQPLQRVNVLCGSRKKGRGGCQMRGKALLLKKHLRFVVISRNKESRKPGKWGDLCEEDTDKSSLGF